jgi:hypothetical protein
MAPTHLAHVFIRFPLITKHLSGMPWHPKLKYLILSKAITNFSCNSSMFFLAYWLRQRRREYPAALIRLRHNKRFQHQILFYQCGFELNHSADTLAPLQAFADRADLNFVVVVQSWVYC